MNSKFLSIPVTIAVLIGMVLIFEFLPIDSFMQSWLYDDKTQTWIVNRNNLILDLLFYSGIKTVFISAILFLLFSMIFLRRIAWVKNNFKALMIVVLSSFIVPLTVGLLKDVTNMPCPNQLVEYGGPYEQTGLFESLGEQQQRPTTKCYPAGHASGGFSLLALLFLVAADKARKITLTLVMILGWSTAGYKMAIGDHFLGHGAVTLVLAWLIILIIRAGIEKIEARFFNKNIHR